MAFDAHKNLAYSTILTAPSPASSGTSLVVQSGDGAKFPAVSFNALVWPINVQPTTANAEVCRVTNIATDTFTITRSTNTEPNTIGPRSIIVGDQIAAVISSKSFTDIEALFASLTNHGVLVGQGANTAPIAKVLTTGQQVFGVTGADPVAGQPILVASKPSNPTGTASASYVMMGLAVAFTPAVTGRVILTVTGHGLNNTINDGGSVQMSYGTGTAPVNGAAATGTVAGNPVSFSEFAANAATPFALSFGVSGLTLATAYWLDLELLAAVGGTASVQSLSVTIHEI